MRNDTLVVVGVLAVLCAPPTLAAKWKETCRAASELAEVVMQIRQSGRPMSELMDQAEEGTLTEKLVIDAYKHERYRTERFQRRAIEQFRDQAYLECTQAARRQ